MPKHYDVTTPRDNQHLLDEIHDVLSHKPPQEWRIGGIILQKSGITGIQLDIESTEDTEDEATDTEITQILGLLGEMNDAELEREFSVSDEDEDSEPAPDDTETAAAGNEAASDNEAEAEPAEVNVELIVSSIERVTKEVILRGSASDNPQHLITLRIDTENPEERATAIY